MILTETMMVIPDGEQETTIMFTLKNEDMSAAFHTVTFYAGNLPSGTYIYRIQTSSFTQLKRCF